MGRPKKEAVVEVEKTERDVRFEAFLQLLKEQSPEVYRQYEEAGTLDSLKAQFQ